jgi:methionine synthase I (cobalamin-dependent)/5,10-methylenetetrahydrofolate reductase
MDTRELFQERLNSTTPILADGAMGTMLHSRGAPLDACFDELNLDQPALVVEIHQAYIEAGAQIIETNSFGANRYKLTVHGLEGKVAEINTAAADLARRAVETSGKQVLVAGSVGPLGIRLAPFGRVKPEDAYRAFHEQIEALVAAGVDLIIVETQSDLYEVREAVHAARDLTSLPIVASITFTRDDRTLLGDNPARVAHVLAESGADVIGANCSSGPAQLLRVIRGMRLAVPDAKFAVMPNAGWPERVSGRIIYPATADYFGEYAAAYCEAGVSMIGGCCGTTPDHIAAMRLALDAEVKPCSTPEPLALFNGSATESVTVQEPTKLASQLASSHFVVSVEMDPPRGLSAHKLLAGAHTLAEAGADIINVADSPMARMRMSPWAVCQLIQGEVGIETILHFPTRGRNLLRVQGDLLAAHALDVRNIFVVMGDPTAIGDYPEATDNYDLVPSGLIKLIKYGFNIGVDHGGSDIGEATSFFVGCALNLSAADIEREMRTLRKKIEAGADFALTQPVYEPALAQSFLQRYRERYGDLEIAILVGVLPLYNSRHMAFLHHEVPGIHIPDSIQRRITQAGEQAAEAGVQISMDIVRELRDVVNGVYLMPPFGRYDMAAQIIESIRGDIRTS